MNTLKTISDLISNREVSARFEFTNGMAIEYGGDDYLFCIFDNCGNEICSRASLSDSIYVIEKNPAYSERNALLGIKSGDVIPAIDSIKIRYWDTVSRDEEVA